eukprot:jgi/Chlat1/1755/Chrsp134S02110
MLRARQIFDTAQPHPTAHSPCFFPTALTLPTLPSGSSSSSSSLSLSFSPASPTHTRAAYRGGRSCWQRVVMAMVMMRVLSRTAGGVLCYEGRAVPNLFLIGGQKCGSTTLWGYVVSWEFGKGEVSPVAQDYA